MELMQLEMFVAMVEEGNFHKAAERVFRTQPAVSMAIRKLEQELGSQLFDRTNRNACVLTDTGEVLYDYAKRLLNLRDEAIITLQQLHNLQRGRIRIGANESTSLYLLRQRNLDFAILSFLPDASDLEATPIRRDELVLIASPQHRLAGRERVHIR